MGSQRGQLAPFLLKRLEKGRNQDLEWVSREDRLFKILWIDQRKTTKPGCSAGNSIFREWEISKGRHKEGMKEDPNRWKQTFRGALTRSPDVEEQHERSNEIYKVFKFSDRMKLKSSVFSCHENKTQINYHRIDKGNGMYHHELISTNNQINAEFTNIPEVVTEALNGTVVSMNSVNSVNKMASSVTTPRMPIPEIMEINVNRMEGSVPSVSPPVTVNDYRFDSDDFKDLFEFKESSSMDISPLPSFNTPDNSIECDKSLVKMQVYYSDNLVLEDEMKNEGIRLFSGSKPVGSYPNLFGPEDFKQVRLPDIRKIESAMIGKGKKMSDTETLLEKMSRGLLLYFNEGKLFAFRLCPSRIIAWNKLTGITDLNRKMKTEHQLFDMKHFEQQMRFYKLDPQLNLCPSPTVTLVFGQPYDPSDNLKKFLIRVELTFVEAEKLFHKEVSNDLQFSAQDSGDILYQKLAKMNIKENIIPEPKTVFQ